MRHNVASVHSIDVSSFHETETCQFSLSKVFGVLDSNWFMCVKLTAFASTVNDKVTNSWRWMTFRCVWIPRREFNYKSIIRVTRLVQGIFSMRELCARPEPKWKDSSMLVWKENDFL